MWQKTFSLNQKSNEWQQRMAEDALIYWLSKEHQFSGSTLLQWVRKIAVFVDLSHMDASRTPTDAWTFLFPDFTHWPVEKDGRYQWVSCWWIKRHPPQQQRVKLLLAGFARPSDQYTRANHRIRARDLIQQYPWNYMPPDNDDFSDDGPIFDDDNTEKEEEVKKMSIFPLDIDAETDPSQLFSEHHIFGSLKGLSPTLLDCQYAVDCRLKALESFHDNDDDNDKKMLWRYIYKKDYRHYCSAVTDQLLSNDTRETLGLLLTCTLVAAFLTEEQQHCYLETERQWAAWRLRHLSSSGNWRREQSVNRHVESMHLLIGLLKNSDSSLLKGVFWKKIRQRLVQL